MSVAIKLVLYSGKGAVNNWFTRFRKVWGVHAEKFICDSIFMSIGIDNKVNLDGFVVYILDICYVYYWINKI